MRSTRRSRCYTGTESLLVLRMDTLPLAAMAPDVRRSLQEETDLPGTLPHVSGKGKETITS